jgi:hypothetical protein
MLGYIHKIKSEKGTQQGGLAVSLRQTPPEGMALVIWSHTFLFSFCVFCFCNVMMVGWKKKKAPPNMSVCAHRAVCFGHGGGETNTKGVCE